MIHNVFVIKYSTREIYFHKQYWHYTVSNYQLRQFLSSLKQLQKATGYFPSMPIYISDAQFVYYLDGDILFVFVSNSNDSSTLIKERVLNLVRYYRKLLKEYSSGNVQQSEFWKKFEELLDEQVITKLKISLVGEGGVGKTTLLKLIRGETPPTKYIPTIAVGIEEVEATRYGTYSIVVWDFAGQERFRRLWRLYFKGSDIVFLVCESTLRGVMAAKQILDFIRSEVVNLHLWVIANKQDLPGALPPTLIGKILGVKAFGMVATDPDNRERILQILRSAVAEYIGDKKKATFPPVNLPADAKRKYSMKVKNY
ncbi:MAG: ADP-ribosylation factor-like protein [Candidatus Asgardarchaeia archaeon]